MWDLPGPGLEPVSPALAGGFLTTAPPGKPPTCLSDLAFPCCSSNYRSTVAVPGGTGGQRPFKLISSFHSVSKPYNF